MITPPFQSWFGWSAESLAMKSPQVACHVCFYCYESDVPSPALSYIARPALANGTKGTLSKFLELLEELFPFFFFDVFAAQELRTLFL